MKILFMILDGAADKPKSALSKAKKPNLDFLASRSFCGLWQPSVPKKYKNYNLASFSDLATLQLLGCEDYPGRGFLEALGIGLKPKRNAIYLRANFATVKNGKIVDRRAGRDEYGLDELAKAINKIKINGVKMNFYRSIGHRGVLVLDALSNEITDSDLGYKIQKVKPLKKTLQAKRTAKILNEFNKVSHDILKNHPINKKRKKPANFILLRGASKSMKTKSFFERFGLRSTSISGVGIIKGIARFLGMDILEVSGANGHLNTNLKGKISSAIDALEKYDFVLLHINGCDEASHDKNFSAKKKFLERVDKEVFSEVVKLKNIIIVVAIDHITSSKTGFHELGAVPILIYGLEENNVKFDEKHCTQFIKNPIEKILFF